MRIKKCFPQCSCLANDSLNNIKQKQLLKTNREVSNTESKAEINGRLRCYCTKWGTIIGGLSPRRIRRGSDRIRSDPPTSPPERPPRRTQADSGGPKKVRRVRLSPPRIRSDPIGSAINWRTVRQKKAAKVSAGKRLGLSPPIGGLSLPTGGLCPPREKSAKRTRRTLSAANKVRQFFSGGKSPRRTFSLTLTLTLTQG